MCTMSEGKLRQTREPCVEQSVFDSKKSFPRRRKGPADNLYRTLMNDKAFSRNAYLEGGNQSISFTFKPTRNSELSFMVSNTALENNKNNKNPMSHFEHNMNYTMRPRCPKVVIRSTEDEDCQDDSSEEDIDALLCNELAEAFGNDIFRRGMTFDNKWGDCSSLDHLSDSGQEESSLHNETFIDNLATSPIIDLEQKSTSTLPASQTIVNIDNAGLRFQLKQETWKLKSEMMNDKKSAMANLREDSSRNSDGDPSPAKTKYWSTNVDFQTKRAAEKLSRDWQTVRRFTSDPSGVRDKPLASRVKFICSENGFQGRRLEVLIQDKFSRAPPLLKRVNTTATAANLSAYMGSVVRTRNECQESALEAIEDESLRACLLAAKDNSNKIWSDCEKLEFA